MFSSIININIFVTFACIGLFFKVNLMLQILWHIGSLFFRSVYSFKICLITSDITVKVLQKACGMFFEENLRNVSACCYFKWRGRWPVVPVCICAVHHAFTYYQRISVALIAGAFLVFLQYFLCTSKSSWDQVFAFLYLSLSLGLAGTFRPPSLTFLSPAFISSIKKHFLPPCSSPLFWPSPRRNFSAVFLVKFSF